MNTLNIGWLYYKDYLRIYRNPVTLFNDVHNLDEEQRKEYFEQHFERKNEVILSEPFEASTSTQLQIVSANQKLTFKTIYPGLTLGTGYTHETGELGEFKLGFFFDHATGYPCIPGSTVKGCLRGMFPQKERDGVADKNEKYDYLASVIRELPNLKEGFILENDLGEEFDQKESSRRKQFIDILEREIFDGEKPERNEDGSFKMKDGKFVFQPLCVYERDIFFDGYIVSTNHPAINRSAYQNPKPFIGDDYITPHQNRKKPEMSPFTNPIPLMFLKILPEVTIQFQFDVKDGLLTKEQKEELFRRLLLDFGIGAKTNVGYGQFDDSSNKVGKTEEEHNVLPENKFPKDAIPFLKKDKYFEGVVSELIGNYYMISFSVNGISCAIRKIKSEKLELSLNESVIVFCSNDYRPDNPNISIRKQKKI